MLYGDAAAITDLWLLLVTVAVMWLAQQGNVWFRTVPHVGEEGLHVEGRVLDVMLESFAAPAHKRDVTCRIFFLLAARNYSYIEFLKRNVVIM